MYFEMTPLLREYTDKPLAAGCRGDGGTKEDDSEDRSWQSLVTWLLLFTVDPLLPSSEQVLTSRIHPEQISGLTMEQGSMDPTYNLNGGFKPTLKRFADLDGPDFFPTPAWATHALLENEHFEGEVWECACGDGAMSRVLESRDFARD